MSQASECATSSKGISFLQGASKHSQTRSNLRILVPSCPTQLTCCRNRTLAHRFPVLSHVPIVGFRSSTTPRFPLLHFYADVFRTALRHTGLSYWANPQSHL